MSKSTTNKPARTRLKVVKKPLPSFPHEIGTNIVKPHHIRAIEWVHGGNLHTRLFEDLVNDGYLKDITEYPEPTFKSVIESYDTYGYLEDYQVQWLINTIHDYRALLETLKSKITTQPGFWDIESVTTGVKIVLTLNNIETLIEELKNTAQ